MGGRFKATLNLFGRKKNEKHFELAPDLNVTGAYRMHKEDSFGYGSIDQQNPRPIELLLPLRPNKSTGNLEQLKKMPNVRNRIPSISQDPRGAEQGDRVASAATPRRKEQKNQEKELKKIQKQSLNEQKAREKQAKEQAKQEKLKEKARKEALPEQKMREKQAQEQAKQEKLKEKARKEALPDQKMRGKQAQEQAKQEILREKARKEALAEQKAREKQAQERAKQDKVRERVRIDAPKAKSNRNDKKKQAPLPQSQPLPQPQPQTSSAKPAYSTNTLESSISQSSGPPPYSESPTQGQQSKDNGTNVIYSKPVDDGSWDIINQHRQQISRPAAAAIGGNQKPKQMVMDLNYNFGSISNNTDNSDA